ncbi:MAG: hypothetical protein JWL69_4845 [Phycisphaerales bacterium]|nr:hypothetical protein [Phycisphaerales bacterium]
MESSAKSWRRGTGFLLSAALGFVAWADLLFYRHVVGWSAALFAAALLAVLIVRPVSGRAGRWPRRVVAGAAFGLVLALVEEPTLLALGMTSIAIVVLAMITRQGAADGAADWLTRWQWFLAVGWSRILHDFNVQVKWLQRHPAARARGRLLPLRVVWVWALPLGLGGVFVALFSAANPVMERWVSRAGEMLWQWVAKLPDLLDPQRIAFWVAVLAGTWGLLRVRTRRARKVWVLPPTPETQRMLPEPYRQFVVRCLLVFNTIFALETGLDVYYLVCGGGLPGGMTFVEYAHRGSYPLVATALLAAAFVLLAFRRGSEDRRWRSARVLVYAWIAQNVLLTFSAGWRLYLLVQSSSLTRLRLSTTIWLGLVAAGLVTIVWRIVCRRDNAWLLRVNAGMCAAVLYACCFLNLDGFIANYDADRYIEAASHGGEMGLSYLRHLGPEALPALARLSEKLNTLGRRDAAREYAEELRAEVGMDLSDWRGWTWRRSRIMAQAGPRVGSAYVRQQPSGNPKSECLFEPEPQSRRPKPESNPNDEIRKRRA